MPLNELFKFSLAPVDIKKASVVRAVIQVCILIDITEYGGIVNVDSLKCKS